MKVLIDTNVLYSAFIRESGGMARLIEWVMLNHDAVITPHIADEILEKVEMRAPKALGAVSTFLSSSNLRFVDSTPNSGGPQQVIRDKDDQSIIDAALDNDIDVILTGDGDFHAMEIDRPRILRPADFITEFINQSD